MKIFPIALLMLAACGAPASWRELRTDAVFEDVWDNFVRIAAQNGYREHPDSDRGRRQFVSRWKTYTGPFRTSKRSRMLGEFSRTTEPDGWRVEYYIERQMVDEIGKSFDVVESDWSSDGQDLQLETIVYRQLQLALDVEILPSERTQIENYQDLLDKRGR